MDCKPIYVHVAVAKCYVPVPDELIGKKIEVNHIDNVKEHNNYQNLTWVTHDANIRQRSLDHAGEQYMPRGAEHWHARKIRVYYLDGTTIMTILKIVLKTIKSAIQILERYYAA